MATLEELIDQFGDLPSIPEAVNRLVGLLSADDPDDEAIESTIAHDPALSLAVLRAANSAVYGATEEARSVHQAIARLGARNLRNVVLAHHMGEVMQAAGRGYGLDDAQARLGGVAGAVAAEMIAARHRRVDPGEAFTAALVRDCGKLVMDRHVGVEELRRTLAELRDGLDLLTFERERFGFDHAEAGAVLARTWELPAPIVTAIGHHHAPPSEDPDPLVDVVYAADVIAAHLGYGAGYDGLAYHLDLEALRRAGVDEADFAECVASLPAAVEAFEVDQ